MLLVKHSAGSLRNKEHETIKLMYVEAALKDITEEN